MVGACTGGNCGGRRWEVRDGDEGKTGVRRREGILRLMATGKQHRAWPECVGCFTSRGCEKGMAWRPGRTVWLPFVLVNRPQYLFRPPIGRANFLASSTIPSTASHSEQCQGQGTSARCRGELLHLPRGHGSGGMGHVGRTWQVASKRCGGPGCLSHRHTLYMAIKVPPWMPNPRTCAHSSAP